MNHSTLSHQAHTGPQNSLHMTSQVLLPISQTWQLKQNLEMHWTWIRKAKLKSDLCHYFYYLWQVTVSTNCIVLIGNMGIVICEATSNT